MAHSEASYKYFLKFFHEWTNKNEYKSQILNHNICYTNVIAIQNTILIAQILIKSAKKKEIVNDTPDTKLTQVCSKKNVLLIYNWHLNLIDNKVVIDLGLQSIKKIKDV